MTDILVRDRMELKYVLTPDEARDLLASMKSDRAFPGFERREGRVVTTYLDRPDGTLTGRAQRSPANNLKIRLREYLAPDGSPTSRFLWVELKERDGQASRKRRFQLHKRLVGELLEGTLDLATVLTCQGRSPSPSETAEAVERIAEVAQGPLVAVGAVRYGRWSLQGGSPEARLTLDREIAYLRGPLDLDELDGPAAWEEPGAVLEVKYAGDEPPRWCETLLGRLLPADYSKFLTLVQLAAADRPVASHVD